MPTTKEFKPHSRQGEKTHKTTPNNKANWQQKEVTRARRMEYLATVRRSVRHR